MDKIALYRNLHVEKWGEKVSQEKLYNDLIEEAAEMIQAVQHLRRKRIEFGAVRTEMADVALCMERLALMYDGGTNALEARKTAILEREIEILQGKLPPRHNDGEDEPPLPKEDEGCNISLPEVVIDKTLERDEIVFRQPIEAECQEMSCHKCKKGTMVSIGLMNTSMPPSYPHKCSECGHSETYDESYPRIVYREKP